MLLSQVIRSVAITGRTDHFRRGVLGRQGEAWTQRSVDAAFPQAAARTHPGHVDAHARAAAVEDLRRRGVLTDAEAARLRAQGSA